MLQRDISVGDHVYTVISGERQAVEVVGIHSVPTYGRGGRSRKLTKFEVRRPNASTPLPKLRSAAALHCTDGSRGEWGGMCQTQDRPGVEAGDVEPFGRGTFTARLFAAVPTVPIDMEDDPATYVPWGCDYCGDTWNEVEHNTLNGGYVFCPDCNSDHTSKRTRRAPASRNYR